MDELDSLLEALAQSTSHNAEGQDDVTEKDGEVTGQVQPVYTTRFKGSPATDADADHVYSEVPEPVEVGVLSPGSAVRELDSIMKGLQALDLDLGIPGEPALSAPPPLVPKGKDRAVEQKEKEAQRPAQVETKTSDLAPAKPASSVPGGKGASIDDLLGDLNTSMEKMGVHTTAKGQCASCGKCIVGKVITALGGTWHPEHFVCCVCGVELKAFFERDGKPFCEADYQKLFSPRCAYCSGPILQNILTAMDRAWHPEHFFCTECGKVFGSEGFLENEGKPYCHEDFYRLFAPKCTGCGQPVKENYLSAVNGTWHPDCFVCTDCLTPFRDGCFMELEGRPLCSLHFHSRQGTLCGGCQTPITGRCVSAMGRRFHPEHFVCAFCLRQLSQGVFKEREEKPYCASCHDKLFI